MWRYHNPVAIAFGVDVFDRLPELIAGRRYALVTYPDALFAELAERLRGGAGKPVLTVSDIVPNPDTRLLSGQAARFGAARNEPEVIVALGGGSVIEFRQGVRGGAGADSRPYSGSCRPARAPRSLRRRQSSRSRPPPAPAARSPPGPPSGIPNRSTSTRSRGRTSIRSMRSSTRGSCSGSRNR